MQYYLCSPSRYSTDSTQNFHFFPERQILEYIHIFEEERQVHESSQSLINIQTTKSPQENAFLITLTNKNIPSIKNQKINNKKSKRQTWKKLPNEQRDITFLQAMMKPQGYRFSDSLFEFKHTVRVQNFYQNLCF